MHGASTAAWQELIMTQRRPGFQQSQVTNKYDTSVCDLAYSWLHEVAVIVHHVVSADIMAGLAPILEHLIQFAKCSYPSSAMYTELHRASMAKAGQIWNTVGCSISEAEAEAKQCICITSRAGWIATHKLCYVCGLVM